MNISTVELKLSTKGLAKESSAFENWSGIKPASNIRVLVVLDGDRSKKYHHFFYVDHAKKSVVGPPEFRRIDSFFSETKLGYKPKLSDVGQLNDLFTREVWAQNINAPQMGAIGKLAKKYFDCGDLDLFTVGDEDLLEIEAGTHTRATTN